MQRRSLGVEDKIFRALALLRSARLISSEETMYLLSLVRLGVNIGRITDVEPRTLNELFLLCQPAHLQKILGQELTSEARAQARADLLRQRLNR